MRLNDKKRQEIFESGTLAICVNGSGGYEDVIESGLDNSFEFRGLSYSERTDLRDACFADKKLESMIERWLQERKGKNEN